jgi:type III secretory pathway component EscV
MEATLEFEMLKDTSVAEMVAEEATKELDGILEEVVNLAETIEGQEPVLDNMVADGEEAVDETDFAMQTGDYLELEIDLPMEATEPQAKTTPLAEETESAFDALIDVENEVMAALAKEVGVNDPGDSLLTVAGTDSEDTDTEKSLAEDSNTREENVCDAPVENTVSDETYDKLPAYNEQSSEDFLGVQESESKGEDVSAPVGEVFTPQGSSDQLPDMLGKKIEATIARLVEERLSIIVEGAILEKLDTIFSSIG